MSRGGPRRKPSVDVAWKPPAPTPMDIHPADKRYRARALRLLVVLVLACGALLWSLDGWLTALAGQLQASDTATVRRWLRGLFAAFGAMLAGPPLLLGHSLRRMGRAAQAEARFPPAAWKTLRDVRVLRGADARRWGRRVERAGSAAFALAGALFGLAVWSLWRFA